MKTTIILDNSQIQVYKECPRKWELAHRESITKAGDKPSQALNYGSYMHMLLDTYYTLRAVDPFTRYENHANAVLEIAQLNEPAVNLRFDFTTEMGLFLRTRFLQYCFNYSINDLRPLFIKSRPQVEIGFSRVLYEDASHLFILDGKIDLISKMNDQIIFVDHKTQSQSKDYYNFDPQFLAYAWATNLNYGLINYIGLQKEYTQKTLHRTLIHFPSHLIEQWKCEVLDTVFWPITNYFKTNFPLNRYACGGPFRTNHCRFTDLCETSSPELFNSIKAFKYVKIAPWSPWRNGE